MILTVGDYIIAQKTVLDQSQTYAQKVAGHLSGLLHLNTDVRVAEDLSDPGLLAEHEGKIHEVIRNFDLINVKIFNSSGLILYSLDPMAMGKIKEVSGSLERALKGESSSHIASPEYHEQVYGAASDFPMLETYVPIRHPTTGNIIGAYEIYQDFRPLASFVKKETVRASLTHILLLVVFALLFFRYGGMTARLMESEKNRMIRDLEDSVEMRTLELNRSKKRIDDLLERKEEMYRSLMIADEYKKNFMGLVSHELRTPLAVIKGYLSLLRDGVLKADQSEIDGAVQTSLDEARHLEAIIDNIIELSQLDRGLLGVSRESVDIRTLFAESIASLNLEIQDRDARVRIDVSDQLSPFQSDRLKVLQVVNQLLSNAVKFSRPGGEVTLSASPSHRGLLIAVSDQGVGIPRAQQREIFDRFYQVDISSTRSYEGSGLGLAIVRRISELLGGRVWVESEEGKGSTFFFEVPEIDAQEIVPIRDMGTEAGETVEIMLPVTGHKRSVLIVDDDPDYLELINRILETEGYTTDRARDGLEALNHLFADKDRPLPSLILLDMRMPNVHGIDFCRVVRRNVNTRDIPIIIISAVAHEKDVKEGLESGANAYLTKPFDTEELLKKIDFLLGHIRPEAVDPPSS